MHDSRLVIHITAGWKENLSSRQQRFREAVEALVSERGYRCLNRMQGSDRVSERYEYIRSCNGVIILAMPQWKAQHLNRKDKSDAVLSSEFMHVAAAMAVAASRPLLVLRESALSERGVFRPGYLDHVIDLPRSLDPGWLNTNDFQHEFRKWLTDVEAFRHVFLGYSSQAEPVGKLIYSVLTEQMGLRVFDWHDFRPGDSIWDSIERAECRTHAGIFLFTADDTINSGRNRQQVPRDNVIYEAAYFAGTKDRKHALIIREDGARVPSDLGGVIYLKLRNRNDLSDLVPQLKAEVTRMLETPPKLIPLDRR